MTSPRQVSIVTLIKLNSPIPPFRGVVQKTPGTIIGGIGSILGLLLLLAVLSVSSGWAALLLLPYVIWSPIGTYTTWEMIHLNPADA